MRRPALVPCTQIHNYQPALSLFICTRPRSFLFVLSRASATRFPEQANSESRAQERSRETQQACTTATEPLSPGARRGAVPQADAGCHEERAGPSPAGAGGVGGEPARTGRPAGISNPFRSSIPNPTPSLLPAFLENCTAVAGHTSLESVAPLDRAAPCTVRGSSCAWIHSN